MSLARPFILVPRVPLKLAYVCNWLSLPSFSTTLLRVHSHGTIYDKENHGCYDPFVGATVGHLFYSIPTEYSKCDQVYDGSPLNRSTYWHYERESCDASTQLSSIVFEWNDGKSRCGTASAYQIFVLGGTTCIVLYAVDTDYDHGLVFQAICMTARVLSLSYRNQTPWASTSSLQPYPPP